jgi:hypothetical protein
MQQKLHPAVRLLPSLTDFAFLMPVLFLFARLDGAKTMLGDGDTGWHVRIGEWMLAHHAVPHTDLFSYTMPNAPFYAWEWLWDLCFGWLHLHYGMTAVVVASILVLCFTSALLFRLVCRHCDNRLIAIGVTFLAVSGSAIHWLARPHLFSMLFTVILLSMLSRVEDAGTDDGRKIRLLLAMPPMFVLWTNLHGGFLIGIMVLAMFAAGALANWLFETDAQVRAASLQSAKRYSLTVLGCAAASFLNPYTYHLHTHLIEFFREPYHFENISEFQSLSFHVSSTRYFEAMLALALVASVGFLLRRRFTPLILTVGWGHAALISARNIPLFLLIASPIVAAGMYEWLQEARTSTLPAWFVKRMNRLSEAAEDFGAMDRLPRVHLASAVVIGFITAGLVLGLVYGTSPSPTWRAEYDPKVYPAHALEQMQHAGLAKRIFTDDEWGDYLAYRLYPVGGKVFVDGRSDFYGGDFERQYIDILNVNYKWQATLDRYCVDTILLRADSPLAGAVKESRRWRVAYDDGIAIVFTPVKADANEFSTTSGKICDAGSSPTEVTGGTQSQIERMKERPL